MGHTGGLWKGSLGGLGTPAGTGRPKVLSSPLPEYA